MVRLDIQQWTAASVNGAGLLVTVGTGLALTMLNVDDGNRVCAVKYGPTLADQAWLLDKTVGTGLSMSGWDSGPGQALKAVPVP